MSEVLHELDAERFEDVQRVGAGYNATVYRAWDRDLERSVALKVSMADTLLDILGSERLAALGIADGLQRFVDEVTNAARSRYTLLREARLLARVQHPNVVSVLDVGVLDGSLTLVMPYLGGGPLDGKRVDGPWQNALELALAIGEGLEAIHDAGLLHRDIKPNNVLRDDKGRPYIIDFGLACGMNDKDALAEWPGTSAYMAPETLAKRHRDQRDDLYAFCVVAFQMLYGHVPFASDAARHEGDISQIKRRGGPSAEIRAVLVRGLHPDPEQRWPNMCSLLEELRRVTQPRQRRWPVFAASAGTVAVSAGLLAALLSSSSNVWAGACEEVSSELATIWNDDIALELRGDVSRVSSDALGDWARRWLEMRARECERNVLRPSACAERLRVQFETTVAVLRRPHEREGVDLLAVIDDLPPPEHCLDEEVVPDEEVIGLQALREHDTEIAAWIAAGDLEQARARLDEYAALAREYGSNFDLARAALRRGEIERRTGSLDAADDQLTFAYQRAIGLGAEALAAEAMLELTALAGDRGEFDVVDAHAMVARAAFQRVEPDRIAELLEIQGAGLIEGSPEQRKRALELLREAVAQRERQHERYGGSREHIGNATETLARALLLDGQLELAYMTAERSLKLHTQSHGLGTPRALGSKKVMFAALVRLGRFSRTEPLDKARMLEDDILDGAERESVAGELRWMASVFADAGAHRSAHVYRELAQTVDASKVCEEPAQR